MNDSKNEDKPNGYNNPNPSHSTRFPYQKAKPAPKGHKYDQTHGLTAILKPDRFKRRRAIDTRFKEGREAVDFRASLIAMKGGEDNLTPTQLAVVDILTAKYYRLLRVYGYLYQQPPPAIFDEKKRRVRSIWQQVDGMEDSLIRSAKEYGFARVAKIVSIEDIIARYENPDDDNPEDSNVTADEGNEHS